MERDSFILYTEQKEIIDKLTDEEAGKLIKAIYEYVQTDKLPKVNNLIDVVIIPFKQNIDRNNKKWLEVKEKRSQAGKTGAEIKKQKKAKQANANFAKNEQANQAVNVNDNVNVNVNDNVNNKTTAVVVGESCVDGLQANESCIDGLHASESRVDGLQNAIEFYNNNIGLITPFGIETFEEYAKEMPEDLIILAMQKAVEADKRTIQYIKGILNNWQKKGIKTVLDAENETKKYKTKTEKSKNANKPDQRDYSDFNFSDLYANKGG